jgi:molecular chaperone DnaK (HSP70)
LPFLIDKAENNNLTIKLINKNKVRPEEVSGAILHRMKIAAENHLNMPVTDAVISVPASFNGIQRQATIDAGKMAGFNVISLMNEPTAAMVGNSYQNSVAEVRKTIRGECPK